MTALAAVLATIADAVTWRIAPSEVNPIVLALPVHAALLGRFAAVALLIEAYRLNPRVKPLLVVATVVGLFGAWSNL